MNESLYEITSDYVKTKDYLDELMASGDIDELTYNDTLDGEAFEVENKISNVARYIKNLETLSGGIKKVLDDTRARKSAVDNKIKYLKEYVKSNMERGELTKIENDDIVVSFRKSTSVIVDDEDSIMKAFGYTEKKRKYDLSDIKEALKSGKVAGAHFQTNNNVQIK